MNNKINIFTKVINILLGFFIICTAMSYTERPLGTTNGKFLIGLIIIGCTITNIDFSKYKWIIMLIVVSILFPLVLMVFGIYNFNMLQSLEYTLLYLFYLILVICLSNVYENRLGTFIFVWQVSLTLVFLSLLVIYRGLSLNLSYLLKATLTNQRYGLFLAEQRYGMGFLNVNTLALFAMLLVFCSCYSLYKKKYKLFSIFDLLFAFILILNAESRTPFVLIIVLAISLMIVNLKNEIRRYQIQNIILGLEIIFAFLFAKLFISGDISSILYQEMDVFSSYRLSFGTAAISMLKNNDSLIFGIGPLNSSYITEKVFGNVLTLDNSLEYYVFTLGIIGAILIFCYLFYLFYQVNISLSKLGFITATFYFSYSFFENTIFLPISAVSLFCLVIIFAIVKRSYDERK